MKIEPRYMNLVLAALLFLARLLNLDAMSDFRSGV